MSRVRLSDQLRQLTSKRNELKHMAHREARSHMCLLLRHALLLSWCDSMSVLLLGTTANQGPFEENQHLASLIQNEVDLLQQLGSKGTPSDWPTTVAGLVSCQPESFETETISPVAEPMQYLHRTMQQTPLEHAADMTAEGVAGFMRSTVISSSIQLHQMRGRPPWEQPSLLQSVASGWDRYMHMFVSLIRLGKQDVLETAHTFNLETLQPEPAEAASHQTEQAALLVPLLGLSEQQQELIAVGMRLYYDLVLDLHTERQALQLKVAAAAALDSIQGATAQRSISSEADCSTAWRSITATGSGGGGSSGGGIGGGGGGIGGGGGGGGSGSGSGSGSADGIATGLISRLECLEQQCEVTNRLQLLLHKEYILRMTAMGWFVGVLTYEQLSRLAIQTYPYPMRVLFLGTEVMKHREKLEQQRLQLLL